VALQGLHISGSVAHLALYRKRVDGGARSRACDPRPLNSTQGRLLSLLWSTEFTPEASVPPVLLEFHRRSHPRRPIALAVALGEVYDRGIGQETFDERPGAVPAPGLAESAV
jgi:hypothetical protein